MDFNKTYNKINEAFDFNTEIEDNNNDDILVEGVNKALIINGLCKTIKEVTNNEYEIKFQNVTSNTYIPFSDISPKMLGEVYILGNTKIQGLSVIIENNDLVSLLLLCNNSYDLKLLSNKLYVFSIIINYYSHAHIKFNKIMLTSKNYYNFFILFENIENLQNFFHNYNELIINDNEGLDRLLSIAYKIKNDDELSQATSIIYDKFINVYKHKCGAIIPLYTGHDNEPYKMSFHPKNLKYSAKMIMGDTDYYEYFKKRHIVIKPANIIQKKWELSITQLNKQLSYVDTPSAYLMYSTMIIMKEHRQFMSISNNFYGVYITHKPYIFTYSDTSNVLCSDYITSLVKADMKSLDIAAMILYIADCIK